MKHVRKITGTNPLGHSKWTLTTHNSTALRREFEISHLNKGQRDALFRCFCCCRLRKLTHKISPQWLYCAYSSDGSPVCCIGMIFVFWTNFLNLKFKKIPLYFFNGGLEMYTNQWVCSKLRNAASYLIRNDRPSFLFFQSNRYLT